MFDGGGADDGGVLVNAADVGVAGGIAHQDEAEAFAVFFRQTRHLADAFQRAHGDDGVGAMFVQPGDGGGLDFCWVAGVRRDAIGLGERLLHVRVGRHAAVVAAGVVAFGHQQAGPLIAPRLQVAQDDLHVAEVVWQDAVQMRVAHRVRHGDRAKAGPLDLGQVGGLRQRWDEDAANAARVQDVGGAALRHLLLAHPNAVEGVAKLFRAPERALPHEELKFDARLLVNVGPLPEVQPADGFLIGDPAR